MRTPLARDRCICVTYLAIPVNFINVFPFSVLLWAFYYLSINPDVEKKVLEELAAVVPDGDITPANIADLK